MKANRIISLLLIFLIANGLKSQSPVDIDHYTKLGESRYIITYEMMKTGDTLKPDEKTFDRTILEIGDGISNFYSYSMHRYDSSYTESNRKGAHSYKSLSHFQKEDGTTLYTAVFKYFNKNAMTIYERTLSNGPVFEYQEDIPYFNWSLSSETKEISGYQCLKATCRFRGRNWTAWYAPQIPIPDGPWKFCQLPGLILQVEDDKGEYHFKCEGIKNEVKPILLYDYFYEKSTYEKVSAFVRNSYKDYYAYSRTINPGIRFMTETKDEFGNRKFIEINPNEKREVPYNPIELE